MIVDLAAAFIIALGVSTGACVGLALFCWILWKILMRGERGGREQL